MDIETDIDESETKSDTDNANANTNTGFKLEQIIVEVINLFQCLRNKASK